jgi:serine/threonine protein phosphatase PrpC
MKPLVKYKSYSVKGLERALNKDEIHITDTNNYVLFILYDGISSSNETNEGISLTNDFIDKNINIYLNKNKLSLKEMMYEANKYTLANGIKKGFSTYVAVYFNKENSNLEYTYSNAGDTRLYEVNSSSLKKISIDDNYINNNIVNKYLGMHSASLDDFREGVREFKVGSRLFLCTDGIFNILEEKKLKIHQILNFKRLGYSQKSLIKEIKSLNNDDASFIIININYV